MLAQKLRVNIFDLVVAIAKVIDLMSPAVGLHHLQVAYWAYQLGDVLELSDNDKFKLFMAGMLHDTGAFSLRERLDLLEFEDSKPWGHAVAGSHILQQFKPFAAIAQVVKYHHLPWRHGQGARHGDDEVHPLSHILHLADRVAVRISPQKQVLGQIREVCESITKLRGDVFVPEHVDALLTMKHREYIWLDATSDNLEAILKRTVTYRIGEFSTRELVAFSQLICRLIDFKSEFTATHSSGVAAVAVELSRLAGFSKDERMFIEIAAYLHDLGKLAIPSEIIEKQGKLTEEERYIMHSHAYYTYQMLEPFDVLRLASQWGSLHQERLNGTGYPFGLDADDLPLGARIMAVADVFTALTEDRPYRKGMDGESVREVLRSMNTRGELDPKLVGIVFRHFDALNHIRSASQQAALHEYNTFRVTLEQLKNDTSKYFRDNRSENIEIIP